jgi:hypoxanthine-guanine phosphoribosyltransferase
MTLGPWAEAARAQSGRQALALCVLRGGVFFFSDLLIACPVTVEPAFCRCRSYEANVDGVAAATVEVGLEDPAAPCAGRHVLVVDDICDSGRTLALARHLEELGAAEDRHGRLCRIRPDGHRSSIPLERFIVGARNGSPATAWKMPTIA